MRLFVIIFVLVSWVRSHLFFSISNNTIPIRHYGNQKYAELLTNHNLDMQCKCLNHLDCAHGVNISKNLLDNNHKDIFNLLSGHVSSPDYPGYKLLRIAAVTEVDTGFYTCESKVNKLLKTDVYLFVGGNKTFFVPTITDGFPVDGAFAVPCRATRFSTAAELFIDDRRERKYFYDPIKGFHIDEPPTKQHVYTCRHGKELVNYNIGPYIAFDADLIDMTIETEEENLDFVIWFSLNSKSRIDARENITFDVVCPKGHVCSKIKMVNTPSCKMTGRLAFTNNWDKNSNGFYKFVYFYNGVMQSSLKKYIIFPPRKDICDESCVVTWVLIVGSLALLVAVFAVGMAFATKSLKKIFSPLSFKSLPASVIHPGEIVRGEKLGEGRFGLIFSGTYNVSIDGKNSAKRVALKHPRYRSTQYAKMIYNEAKVLSSLRVHPNVINLIGYVKKTKSFPLMSNIEYLVLPFCDNLSLKDYLAKYEVPQSLDQTTDESLLTITIRPSESQTGYPPLTLFDLLSYSWQLASALAHLHGVSYLHGDVSLRNVLLTGDGICKLADFGMAFHHRSDEENVPADRKFRFQWWPLETLKNGRILTESEVWAFGVVLCEIFELGKEPCRELTKRTYLEILETTGLCKKEGSIPLCPPCISALMNRCWDRIPSERGLMEDHLREIRHWLQHFYPEETNLLMQKLSVETKNAIQSQSDDYEPLDQISSPMISGA